MSDDRLDIVVGTSLDQSSDAVGRLKKDVATLEKGLKDTKLKLQVELDNSTMEGLKNQFADIQVEVQKLKNSANFNVVNEGIRATTVTTEQMSEALKKVREEAKLISERTKFDLLSGKEIQRMKTYQDSFVELRSTVENLDGEGNVIGGHVEINNKHLEVQKKLYNELKSLQAEMLSLEKQKIKLSGEDSKSVSQYQQALSGMTTQVRETLSTHQLINPEMEKQLELAQQLKWVQVDIAKTKDTDSQGRKAYAELSKLQKEEFRTQEAMVGAEGQRLEILRERLSLFQQSTSETSALIQEKGLSNEREENELLRERELLKSKLIEKEEKLTEKESVRIQKLNEKISDIDFSQTPFGDNQAIQDFVLSLEGAGTEIVKFDRRLAAGNHQQVQMTTSTQLANNKIKEQKIVVDQTTGGVYKLGEAYKEVSNRNLSFVNQMGIAMTRLIQWGISTHLLYSNLRKMQEGVEIVKELNKELTQVAVITGNTKEETQQLAQSYAVLGKEMGKTAKEISEINTELIRQGLPAEESYNRMQTILKLSAAGGLAASETMSIITSSVNALGEDAVRTADVLLKAGNISASSVEEIGEALTKTASSARATGLSLEDLSAILSMLTEVTQESPSSLGNSLKTLLARFNAVNEETGETNEELNKVQKAFESVGVAFTDGEGQIRPLFELLTDLDAVWGSLDKNTKMYISTISAGKQNLMPAHIVICVKNILSY